MTAVDTLHELATLPLPFERERAACFPPPEGVNFLPQGSKGAGASREATAARAICEGCEVRADCLAYALAMPGGACGVWGGFLFNEGGRHNPATKAAARAWLIAHAPAATPPLTAPGGGATAPAATVQPELDEVQTARERARRRAFEPPPPSPSEMAWAYSGALTLKP
jgi:hypothetical protein